MPKFSFDKPSYHKPMCLSNCAQPFTNIVPVNARQNPSMQRLDSHAFLKHFSSLRARVKQQLIARCFLRECWMIFNQNKSRAFQLSVFKMKRYLMRTQVYLQSFLHHLQLHHHELPQTLQRYQTVRDSQIHPRLDPRYMTRLEIFL